MTNAEFPSTPASAGERPEWLAYIALGTGLLGVCAWFLPVLGCPVALAGIVTGILGINSKTRTLAIIGLVLCSLSLLATVANAAIGAYLGATGQLSIFQ
jgi:hypothetical protein